MASGPVGGGQRVQEATAVEMLRARCSMNTAGYSQHRTHTRIHTHPHTQHTQRSDPYLKDTLFGSSWRTA